MFRTALIIGLLAALAAVAAHADTTGTRIDITMPAGAAAPSGEALLKALEPPSSTETQRQVRVVADKTGGAETVRLEIWGSVAADPAAALRAAFPSLQSATITVAALTEPAPTREAIRVMVDGDPSDPATVEALKTQIKKRLQEEGKDGDVDVQVETTEDGKRKVEVKVRRVEEN